jgi:hypothetical protein
MRITAMIFLSLSLFGLAAPGCGGSLDCDAFCQKSVECDSTTKLSECQSTCAHLVTVSDSSYLSAVSDCLGKSCNEVAACGEAATASCSNDPTPFFDDYCTKQNMCNSAVTVESCKATLA